MNDMGAMMGALNQGQERFAGLLDRLLASANPRGVYGEPVVSGEHLVVTASEVWAGVGFGSGTGGGTGPNPAQATQGPQAGGTGVGIGGGGGASGRPVAVIDVSPQGVTVHPVFDIAKLGLAALTTLSTMALTLGRFARPKKH